MRSSRELMMAYFEGELSDEELRELQASLLSDPDLCNEFVGVAEIHGRLMGELSGGDVLHAPPRRRLPRWIPAGIGLAASLALLVGGWWWVGHHGESEPDLAGDAQPVVAPQKRVEFAVARVIHIEDGRWGLGRDREVEIGEWLLPGNYHLQAGAVVVALDVGGTARFEGPAVFEIIDANQIRLESGDLQARFEEPGHGFTVSTPEGAVVDLGTEFRVEVSGRESKVEVLEGRVRATAGNAMRELSEHESVSMHAGALTVLAPGEADPMPDEFENENPVVFYHWSFEDREGEHFVAGGSEGADMYALSPGVPGRIPERIEGVEGQALRFSGTGEFLLSPYRGVSGSKPRTVAAWVRIPSDAKPQESYGWAGWGLPGEHSTSQKWQISWNPQVKLDLWTQPLSPGSLAGALRTEFGPGWVNGTRDLRDSEWHHLVSIFIGGEDPDVASHIRHYVDGRLEMASGYQRHAVKTDTGEESLSLLVGHHSNDHKVLLDLPGEDNSTPYFTGFRGDLDELYIFEGALTSVQVWRLYKDGRPPQPGMISPSLGTLEK